MPLVFDAKPRARVTLRCRAAARGVLSWNTTASDGSLAFRIRYADESWSELLPYVRWSNALRISLGGSDERARIEVDELLTTEPFTALEVHSNATLEALALATPPKRGADGEVLAPIELNVPKLSQYVGDPGRGWCSPASLAMLLQAQGIQVTVGEAARATFDDAYHGTGNWAFNVAYASRFGLRAFVAYLKDLAHARRFLAAGVPLALSFSWREGELEDPPLPASDGHVAVLRGFDAHGDPVLNDPAQPQIRVVYKRAAFERLWLEHGGVAYVIAPPEIPTVQLANR
ncbi:MAG: peptidase C39 family protein [Candidatus Eremiobacteraeota bacterium]|nr:peptidase C39 family protein [Candidatus Eremiobacteraeota bacterium]